MSPRRRILALVCLLVAAAALVTMWVALYAGWPRPVYIVALTAFGWSLAGTWYAQHGYPWLIAAFLAVVTIPAVIQLWPS
jgi:hypothetical protein